MLPVKNFNSSRTILQINLFITGDGIGIPDYGFWNDGKITEFKILIRYSIVQIPASSTLLEVLPWCKYFLDPKASRK